MEAVNLNRLVYFTAVVYAGSFTRAAERLGITKAVVSQQVAKLERELNTTLLMRTTRRVAPTEAGRLLHARAVTILRAADDAFAKAMRANDEPAGLLRIAAPNNYGSSVIAPLVALFARRHPTCQIDLRLSDARIDLVANHIDLAIRVGWLDDSSLQARRVGSFGQHLVAAPALAASLLLDDPDDPDDLGTAPFIANGALRDGLSWVLTGKDGARRTVRMRQAIAIDATPAVLAATIAGGGLSVLPDFLISKPLVEGGLAELLPEWVLPVGGIHVVYPAARFRPRKVIAFVDLLVTSLREAGVTTE